jgi:hypothetical protein
MSTIKVNSIVPNSGTHVSGAFTGTFSGSIENGRLDRLESFSSSLDAAFATDAQLTSLSASLATRINAATNEQDLSGLATKVALNDFTASYVTDSASFADRIDNVGGGTATDISALNDFTGSYSTDSASFADRIDAATNEQDLSNLATTGSNSFEGNQNINGDFIITGSTLSLKKSTDSDPLFTVDVNSKRLGLVQGNGEIPGEFYLALSGSTAFLPRPDKTMFYGSRGFTFRTTSGIVSEFTNNRTSLTGSLLVSASNLNYVEFNTPRLTVLNGEFGGSSRLELVRPNNDFKIYANDASTGTWMISENRVKMMTPITQLSQLNDEPGIVNVIGALNVTGSIGISGSIVPAVGAGEYTSSFSLGSATNAWKDLWVSNGTINFLGPNGSEQGRLSSNASGLSMNSLKVSGSFETNGNQNITGSLNVTGKVNILRETTQSQVAIGDRTLGGIVAYILQPGDPGYDANVQKGLVVSETDIPDRFTETTWGGYNMENPSGAFSTAIGSGNSNTEAIIAAYTGSSAARLCAELTLGGYSDWYLPSKDELNKIWENRVAINPLQTDPFGLTEYWSSTVADNGLQEAWRQSFSNSGAQDLSAKLYENYVRAVRSFTIQAGPSLSVSGSVDIHNVLKLTSMNPLPTGSLGSMAVSGSSLYFHNGTAWKGVLLDA